MAAGVLRAPLAFVTIVDDAYSFWKSCYGVPPDAPHRNTVDESFCQYVVRSERELVVGDAGVDDRVSENPSIAAMGVRAWLGFPLLAPGGEVLGSFCVVDLVPREWSNRDIELTRTFAAAASREIALRDALRFAREEKDRAEALAGSLQESLLPPRLMHVPGLDVAAVFHPAGTGVELVGDFYDLLAANDETWGFMVGDVCGKGVEAAKLAVFARYTVGAVAMHVSSPALVLTWLNEAILVRSPVAATFLTAVYGSLKMRDGECVVRLARAGHPPPVIRRAGGALEFVEPQGQLIGVSADVSIDEIRFVLAPGDALIVYTDGIDEARAPGDGAVFGSDALLATIASAEANISAEALAHRLARAAIAFSGGIATDDIAVVVVRVPG